MVLTREVSFNLSGNVSSMGLAVAGTAVRLYDYWRQSGKLVKHFLAEQVTDAKGGFGFDVRKGIYCVELIPSDNTRFARQSLEAIKVTSNTNFDILLKSGAILEGQVTDAEGNCINDGELLIFGIAPHVIRVSQRLDDEGRYSLTLPPGKYYLAVVHKGSPETPKTKKHGPTRNLPFFCPLFQVLELSRDTQHDIQLPKLLRFSGKVTNGQGHPTLGVKCTVTCNDRFENIFYKEIAMKVQSITHKDGAFEFMLQAGTYSIKFQPPEDSGLAEKSMNGLLVDSDRDRNYALDPGFALTGQVMNGEIPVPNATVNVVGVNLDSVCLSDEDGSYTFSLPGGNYELVVGTQPDSLGSVAHMELAPHRGNLILGSDMGHDIQMEEGVLVTGTVHDPLKQPRAGVLLSLYATKDGEFDMNYSKRRPLWIGITGDDGTYEFRLMPDRYWLVLNNQSSTGHYIDVSEEKTVGDLSIEDVCLLNFEIVSETDEAIPNCQVSFEVYDLRNEPPKQDEIEEIAMPVFTDNNGRCTFTLAQGVYSFDFHPPEHSGFTSRLIRQLSVSSDMTRRVRLLPKEEQVLS